MRELSGGLVWVALSGFGLSFLAIWPRWSLSGLQGSLWKYAIGFAAAGTIGHGVSIAVERAFVIHTCHFLTLALAVLGGAAAVGWGRMKFDWIPARLVAMATFSILLLPLFLGA